MTHRSFGPLDETEFKKLIVAPAGEAIKVIRRYDPNWGRVKGGKQVYIVTVTRTVYQTARENIEANDEDEAEEIAMNMDTGIFDWDDQSDSGHNVTDVEAYDKKKS